MNINISHPKICFGTNSRKYKAGPLKETIYTTSHVIRDDLDFERLTNYMIKNYEHAPKVNVYSMACSDGSEAWTLAMFLKNKNADKFLPIKGVDVDYTILDCANSTKLNILPEEIKKLKQEGIDFNKYFVPSESYMYIYNDSLADQTKTYIAKRNIADCFRAERKTVMQEISTMTKEFPNIVLCRNFFPYMGTSMENIKYVKAFSEKLAKNDILAIGDFDRSLKFIEILNSYGFEEIFHNVFKKIK